MAHLEVAALYCNIVPNQNIPILHGILQKLPIRDIEVQLFSHFLSLL